MTDKEPSDIHEYALRVNTKTITDYILRGNGRRIVPKAVYLAAWELEFAMKREEKKS